MKKRKIISLFFLLVLTLSVLSFTKISSAQPLSFNPPVLEVKGNLHDLVIIPVEIINSENISVDVSMRYIGSISVFIPNTVFSIPALSSRTFNIGFIVEHDEVGWIEYNVGLQNFSQLVIIKIDKASPVLSVFPSSPKAGSNVAFLITSGEILDAHGFLFCSESGNTYDINIFDGMGTIRLDENETGTAVIRIVGEGLNPLIANFTIQPKIYDGSDEPGNNNPVVDPVVITAPETVIYGETKEVTVTQGTKPLAYESILVTSPVGQSNTWSTNSFGKYQITFNVVGTWSVSVLGGGSIITKSISCVKENTVIYLQTSDPLVDNEVELSVFDGATVKVEGPDGYIENGVALNSKFSFTPDRSGSYTVTAESTNKKGTLTFNVKTKPRIVLTDISGNPVSFNVKAGKSVYVRLVDSNNELLDIDTTVDVKQTQLPFSVGQEISLIDSYGVWLPAEAGSYTLSFSGVGNYYKTETTIQVVSASDGGFSFSMNIWFLLLGFVIFVVVIVVVLKKYPPEFIRQKFRIRREEKKSGRKPSGKTDEPV